MSLLHSAGRARRPAAVAAAVLLGVAPLMLTTAGTAAAATSCSGSLIDSAAISAGGAAFGTLFVYYDSASGRNCAKATNNTGVRTDLAVSIRRCRAGTGQTASSCDPIDTLTQGSNYDRGEYISYAGPVETKGPAAGLCIYAAAQVVLRANKWGAEIGGHCD